MATQITLYLPCECNTSMLELPLSAKPAPGDIFKSPISQDAVDCRCGIKGYSAHVALFLPGPKVPRVIIFLRTEVSEACPYGAAHICAAKLKDMVLVAPCGTCGSKVTFRSGKGFCGKCKKNFSIEHSAEKELFELAEV